MPKTHFIIIIIIMMHIYAQFFPVQNRAGTQAMADI